MSIKISCVMASFLGEYDFSSTDKVRKFHRAIESFLNQSYKEKELWVISDGCDITTSEIRKYDNNPEIKHVHIEKQPMFSGNVRNVGCIMATGSIICYLDSDDMLGEKHLEAIANGFKHYSDNNIDVDWVYFDDYVIYRFHPILNYILTKEKRDVELDLGSIGTSSIAHKNILDISWVGFDGYNHDWHFIKNKLIDSRKKYQKIENTEYFVCHIPKSVDS